MEEWLRDVQVQRNLTTRVGLPLTYAAFEPIASIRPRRRRNFLRAHPGPVWVLQPECQYASGRADDRKDEYEPPPFVGGLNVHFLLVVFQQELI